MPINYAFWYRAVPHILAHSVKLDFGPKSSFRNEFRAWAGFGIVISGTGRVRASKWGPFATLCWSHISDILQYCITVHPTPDVTVQTRTDPPISVSICSALCQQNTNSCWTVSEVHSNEGTWRKTFDKQCHQHLERVEDFSSQLSRPKLQSQQHGG